MDNAKEVLEKADATQEEVDNAITALQEAKEALVKAEETVVSKTARSIYLMFYQCPIFIIRTYIYII